MFARQRTRTTVSALLALVALAFQASLPALHPQHGAAALSDAQCVAAPHGAPVVQHAADLGAAHDGLNCPLCATIAQGRAGVLTSAPTAAQAVASHAAAPLAVTRLLAAPALTRAAPRAPPALA